MINSTLHLKSHKGMQFVYSLTGYKPVNRNGPDEEIFLYFPAISTAYLIMFNHYLK
ncbi:hypothetical protein J2780_000958 [Chryseobacterium camelliae]|nr:hypothetical protein [Chryseobacterium camelliae]